MFLVNEEDVFLVPLAAVSNIVGPILVDLVICEWLQFLFRDNHILSHFRLGVNFASEHAPRGNVASLVEGHDLVLVFPETKVLLTGSHTNETEGRSVQKGNDSYAVVRRNVSKSLIVLIVVKKVILPDGCSFKTEVSSLVCSSIDEGRDVLDVETWATLVRGLVT